MIKAVELHHGAATDVGQVRDVNEDAYLVAPPAFVVADGMGGHDRGDVASRIVVEEFGGLADASYDAEAGAEAVARTLTSCQERIAEYDAAQHAAGALTFGTGTTAVVALLVEQEGNGFWLLANVGDSRIYRCDADELEQISIDHSVVQEMIDSGEIDASQASEHPSRHVITRALGGATLVEADYFLLPLATAERLLLCSDGINGMIGDDEIARIMRETEDPRDAADRLVAAAVSAGGHDNATAVVVDVVGLAHDNPYDSDAQRESLEQKLGALP